MWHGASAVEVPAPDRFDWFVETISSALMPSALSARDAAAFHAEGAFLGLGPVQLSRFSYSPLRSRRTPALIRRGDPEQYQLGLVTRGSAWYAQGGSEAELHAGDMVLWDTSRPYDSGSGLDDGSVEVLVLQIPKARLPLAAPQVDQLVARRMDSTTGIRAVLAQFLGAVVGNGSDCRPGPNSRRRPGARRWRAGSVRVAATSDGGDGSGRVQNPLRVSTGRTRPHPDSPRRKSRELHPGLFLCGDPAPCDPHCSAPLPSGPTIPWSGPTTGRRRPTIGVPVSAPRF
ncbi:hypothetical protein EES42_39955 [Streptomyces sp. ADI95-17]|nr:hypothetical protein EES42_39955 [Streptomyces sp. ADI95-17]